MTKTLLTTVCALVLSGSAALAQSNWVPPGPNSGPGGASGAAPTRDVGTQPNVGYGQPGTYNQYNQQAAAPMESQMGCRAPGPHQVAITDEYGFTYDGCGDRLNARGNVISPHTR